MIQTATKHKWLDGRRSDLATSSQPSVTCQYCYLTLHHMSLIAIPPCPPRRLVTARPAYTFGYDPNEEPSW